MSNAREIADAGHQLAAWVNFDGTLAMTVGSSYGPNAPPADFSSPNPIRASFNVASITDNGNGIYVINLATAMPDANYVVTTAWQRSTGSVTIGYNMNLELFSLSTSSFGIKQLYFDGTTYDAATVCAAIFR